MKRDKTTKKARKPRRELKIVIKKLRDEIPERPECIGCGECCGPVKLTREEMLPIVRMITRRGLWPQVAKNMIRSENDKTVDGKDRNTCPLLEIEDASLETRKTRCMVYSKRPIVCRLYNNVQDMKCPRGPWPWTTQYRKGKNQDKYFEFAKFNLVDLRDELMSIIKDQDDEMQKQEAIANPIVITNKEGK